MGRLLTLITLMILGALAVRTQEPSPYTTRGRFNGVNWREATNLEKMSYALGATDGFRRGLCWGSQEGNCKPRAAAPSWFYASPFNSEVVKEIDSFYEDGANISLPMIYAYEYSRMRMAGSTKAELDSFLKGVR